MARIFKTLYKIFVKEKQKDFNADTKKNDMAIFIKILIVLIVNPEKREFKMIIKERIKNEEKDEKYILLLEKVIRNIEIMPDKAKHILEIKEK